jgi:uncharacterized membrane protein
MFAFSILLLAVAYLVWSLVCLEKNYKRAKEIGIPLVQLPIDPIYMLFQVFGSHV